MANEIQVMCSLSCSNGNFSLPKLGGQVKSANQTVRGGGVPGMLTLSTTDEAVPVTDLTDPGWVYMKNMEDAGGANIIYGPETGGAIVPFGLLKPGEETVLQLATGVTLRVDASAGTPKLQIIILDK